MWAGKSTHEQQNNNNRITENDDLNVFSSKNSRSRPIADLYLGADHNGLYSQFSIQSSYVGWIEFQLKVNETFFVYLKCFPIFIRKVALSLLRQIYESAS